MSFEKFNNEKLNFHQLLKRSYEICNIHYQEITGYEIELLSFESQIYSVLNGLRDKLCHYPENRIIEIIVGGFIYAKMQRHQHFLRWKKFRPRVWRDYNPRVLLHATFRDLQFVLFYSLKEKGECLLAYRMVGNRIYELILDVGKKINTTKAIQH